MRINAMKAQSFQTPAWDNGHDEDVTGQFFLDLDPDGDTQVVAVYRETATNFGGHYINRDVDTAYTLDGLRIIHNETTTEWRDRAWLVGQYGAADVGACDAHLSNVMGVAA